MTEPVTAVPAAVTPAVKPGWQTTEFWLNILVKIYVIVLSLKGFIPAALGAMIVGIMTGVYTIARAIVKKISPNAAIPDLPADT